MSPPTGRRDQLIRDLLRERVLLGEPERYLQQHMKPEIGGLNVKQTEGILALIEVVDKMMQCFVAINSDMHPIQVSDRGLQIKYGEATIIMNKEGSISLRVGPTSLTMSKDGTIDIKGKDVRLNASGEVVMRASKDMVLKGQRIMEN